MTTRYIDNGFMNNIPMGEVGDEETLTNKDLYSFFDDLFAESSKHIKMFAISVPVTGRAGGGSIMWQRKKRFAKKREKLNVAKVAMWYVDHGLAEYMIENEQTTERK